MPSIVIRLLLSIVVVPLAALFYFLMCIVGYRILRQGENGSFMIAGISTWVILAVTWIMIWASQLRWDAILVSRTSIAAVVALFAGVLVGAGTHFIDDDLSVLAASMVTPLLWLLFSVYVWRAADSSATGPSSGEIIVTCPRCTYNLAGLHDTKCPECGTQYTLDNLIAKQPWMNRSEVDLSQ